MRLIKPFAFVVLGFFVLISAISLLIPSKVVTTKSAIIHAPKEKILAAIIDFQVWRNWHPLFRATPELQISEPSTGVGAHADWTSSSKQNSLRFVELMPDGVKIILDRSGENPIENILLVLAVEEAGTYHVEWRSLTKLKWYPWEKFAGIFVSDITGPGYEAALNELKKLVEVTQ